MKKLSLALFILVFASCFFSCTEEQPASPLLKEESIPVVGDDGTGKKIFVHDLLSGETVVFAPLAAYTPFLITGTGERGNYFFITGNSYNKLEGYIDSIRVFSHNSSGIRNILGSPKVSKIFANSLDGNTLNLVLYHLELVNQRIYKDNYIIDSTGRIVDKAKEKYELMQGEIPEVPAIKVNNVSPDSTRIVSVVKGKSNQIFLSDAKDTVGKMILSTDQNVDRIYWTPDKETLIMLTSNLDVHKTDRDTSSTLMIYSLKKMDYVAKFSGQGYRNFAVKKDYLIFDDLENQIRLVRVYDLKKLTDIRRIKMKNGCSIRFLPFY
ncbi:MAG: hypothetical protein LCH52_06940 [Bacteroidetes bacterium]|nr:hypothetical protein [Bacteroidota bacterium]